MGFGVLFGLYDQSLKLCLITCTANVFDHNAPFALMAHHLNGCRA
jgi:hypothetical protein